MFFFSRALWTLAYVLHTIICPPNENTWMDARHASRTVNAYFIISMCAHYCAIHQIHNGWPFCALLQVSVQHCWLLRCKCLGRAKRIPSAPATRNSSATFQPECILQEIIYSIACARTIMRNQFVLTFPPISHALTMHYVF